MVTLPSTHQLQNGLCHMFKRSLWIHSKSGIARHVIHEKNYEEKLMFGRTLESKEKKRRRLKKEGDKPSPGSEAPDSEEFWQTKLNPKFVKVFKRTNEGIQEVEKEGNLEKTNNEINFEEQKAKIRKRVKEKLKLAKSKTRRKEAENNEHNSNGKEIPADIKTEKVEIALGSSIQIPHIVVRNITNFPLLRPLPLSRNEVQTKSMPNLPSVSKILNATMSESARKALDKWKENLVLELGEDGFIKYSQGLMDKGARFHSCVRNYLDGAKEEDIVMESDIEGCWRSVSSVLREVSDIQILEGPVAHPKLYYKGIIDCVARYRNNPCVIEWKKSDKQKPELSMTFDAPLQLCAYLGALSHDNRYQHVGVENGLVVVAYTDGSPANVFEMNVGVCLKYWNLWLERLQKYWTSHNSV